MSVLSENLLILGPNLLKILNFGDDRKIADRVESSYNFQNSSGSQAQDGLLLIGGVKGHGAGLGLDFYGKFVESVSVGAGWIMNGYR